MIEAMKHYEAALLKAFPKGASGDVFEHWNKARQAIAKAEKQEPVSQLLADKAYLLGMKAGYNLAMINDGKNFNAAIAAYEKQIIAHGIKE